MSAVIPEPGTEILLIVRDMSVPAVIVYADATRVIVRVLDGHLLPPSCAREVVLVAGTPGSRLTARGRLAMRQGSDGEFALDAPWAPLDRRVYDRYPARLRGGIRTAGDAEEFFAVTLDVSLGGVAIEVLEDPGVDEVELSTGFVDSPPFVPCEVVSRRILRETTILHLRFGSLDAAQRRHVDSLVRVVQELDQAA